RRRANSVLVLQEVIPPVPPPEPKVCKERPVDDDLGYGTLSSNSSSDSGSDTNGSDSSDSEPKEIEPPPNPSKTLSQGEAPRRVLVRFINDEPTCDCATVIDSKRL